VKFAAGLGTFLFLAGCLSAGLAAGAEHVRLFVSGSAQSAQAQMGRDLARLVTRSAGITLDIRPVAGTPEALLRLHETGALQLAMLQADAAHAYFGATLRGNPEASRMVEPVRIVAQLHREQIYFIVRSDSPMSSLHDLAPARINVGPPLSGTALTASHLYRLLFGTAVPEAQVSFLPPEDALVKLITEKNLDAVAIVASRPAPLLANMKAEARNFIKLLRFDADHPAAKEILNAYVPSTALAADYPNLLASDLPVLSVDILLAASGHGEKSKTLLAAFANAWCRNLARLESDGIPQWKDIAPYDRPMAQGWAVSHIAEREIRACREGIATLPEPCPREDRLLGLCE
jgi:TRAP-type uncharacterized transport system substrate-binding protein